MEIYLEHHRVGTGHLRARRGVAALLRRQRAQPQRPAGGVPRHHHPQPGQVPRDVRERPALARVAAQGQEPDPEARVERDHRLGTGVPGRVRPG